MITLHANRILIPVDFSSTAQLAIAHGASIAKAFGGEIILLHVQRKNELVDIILPALEIEDVSIITKFLENKLEETAGDIRKEYGIPVTAMVSLGHVTSEIASIAHEYKAGLIIMGTLGADSHNDLFLGSNSYKVLTKSEIPVMTVRTKASRPGYKHIVLPLDSSEHSRQKVIATLQLAAKFSSTLHVLGLVGTGEENYRYKMEVISKQIGKLAKEYHVSCKTDIVETANRSKETLQYAQNLQADLIVIMADQRTELRRAILSSYAHEIINNSNIPVISIPPEIHVEYLAQDSIGGMW
jgi:nucleotide-binding universal stress UspA family protein